MKKICLYLLLISLVSCHSRQYRMLQNGIVIRFQKTNENTPRFIKLQLVNEKVIHVTATVQKAFSTKQSLMSLKQQSPKIPYNVEQTDSQVILSTALLKAVVSLKTGGISFYDSTGNVILSEKQDGGKSFMPTKVNGLNYYKIREEFDSPDDEAFFGLGENQCGIVNYKGKDADLCQLNTIAVVPFLVSNRNYGILWDNYSRSKFGDVRDFQELSSLKLYDKEGKAGGLSAIYSLKRKPDTIFTTRKENEISYEYLSSLKKFPEKYSLKDGLVQWTGSIEPDTSGIHKFLITAAGYIKVWIDEKLILDRWRQPWNPGFNKFYLPMEKGKQYKLKIEWIPDGEESFISVKHLNPLDQKEQNELSLFSEVADEINYYFIYGNNLDEVISGYRTVTGKSPVMPKWSFGLWQSRERYKTQSEVLSTVQEFRKRKIPLDNIVLDWQYWKEDKWGDHEFDSSRFSNPDSMIRVLHDSLHTHFMISVWPKYYTGTKNYERMNEEGWLYRKNIDDSQKDWIGYVSTFYDAFNDDARKDFWKQINTNLFNKGVDAWWLDATEPDIHSNVPMQERQDLMNPTALGPAAEYFNAYPLVHSKGVYEGQRSVKPDQRVFILTRSAYAGLQRYSAAVWSGDIASRWYDMKLQVPAGISFSISGMPYWTMDIGGFAVENRYVNPAPADLEEWREQMARWFQFGAFCPIFRVHGAFPFREMFHVAPEYHPAYQSMVSVDKLRYRLMPYIYSLAGMTYQNDYTIMRALVMDFPSDKAVYNIDDQYMFGPSLLISPVFQYLARTRELYLPSTTGWYELVSGKYFSGGQRITTAAPLNTIPVFIKEGSILPFGSELQYSDEKPADPIALVVYTGRDAQFTIYEDENVNYNYEKGAFSLIPVKYNEDSHTLTIGKREGSFPGMLENRTFQIIWVRKDRPFPLNFSAKPDKEINYTGDEQEIRME